MKIIITIAMLITIGFSCYTQSNTEEDGDSFNSGVFVLWIIALIIMWISGLHVNEIESRVIRYFVNITWVLSWVGAMVLSGFVYS